MYLKIDSDNIKYPDIKKAVDVLKSGGVIIYPTDTVYGLGCDIFNPEAIDKIYKIKQKSKNTGVSFICPDLKEISKYAIVEDYAYRIMKKLLPGAYTFVLRATKFVPKEVLPKRKTVGIRIPNNEFCLKMVKELGHPIVSTSVNISGEEEYSDPEEMEKVFGDKVDLIIDAGILPKEPSTVVSLIDGEPVVLREGKGDISYFSKLD